MRGWKCFAKGNFTKKYKRSQQTGGKPVIFLAGNLKTGNFKTLITLPYTFLSIQTTPTRALYSKVLSVQLSPFFPFYYFN